MRMITVILASIMAGATALAQQSVPPPPQPAPDKPAGPSLEATMRYIQDKLNEQGKIVFAISGSYRATGESYPAGQHSEESQVIAVDPAGGLSVQKSMEYPGLNDTETWRLNFKDVGKLEVLSSSDSRSRIEPGWEFQISPQFFYLDIHLKAGRTVQKHVIRVWSGKHGKTMSSDSSAGELLLSFCDEESADRAAKAFVHAVELCGGGSKPELF